MLEFAVSYLKQHTQHTAFTKLLQISWFNILIHKCLNGREEMHDEMTK